jgi:hypothetical protein
MIMHTLPLFETSARRRLLTFTGFAAIPLYLVPVSIWGSRSLWPRAVRHVTTGALALGVLSLLGLSLRQPSEPAREKTAEYPKEQRWKLPLHGPIMPEEFAASAASGR